MNRGINIMNKIKHCPIIHRQVQITLNRQVLKNGNGKDERRIKDDCSITDCPLKGHCPLTKSRVEYL